jgi:hypothetical protein
MYHKVGKRWMSKRGTSRVEGWHKWLNGLPKANNYSQELWDHLLTAFVHRWNHNAGAA